MIAMQLRLPSPVKSIARQSRVHSRRPLRRLRIRCEEGDEDKQLPKTPETVFKEQLKKQGFQKENAQRILQLWKDSGAESPEQLRRLFIRGSLRPLSVVLLQLVLDAGATFGSFTFASTIGFAPGLPFPIIFSLLGTLAGFYFLTSTAFDVVTLGSIGFSIYRFGTNTEAFLKALESIAGGSELNVIDKVKKIVDIFKVIGALNEIADILKEKGAGEISTLESLSAYLTLSHAETNYGFRPQKYGLTEEEATNIAVVFSRYDKNDDGVLQTSELGGLVAELGTPLDDDELNAAMQLLDTDKSGVIEFEEFVDWWVNKVIPLPTKQTFPVHPGEARKGRCHKDVILDPVRSQGCR